ncbi:mandelate racemase/muconate lactonizing enzyme family protein [Niabella sp. CC-SYL272]|uniref:mandelate racemase/muconate lactonizing enzyme family protein n=1 Tax=Niabella agricola TaxID=2891571 RepID=UPI001F1BCED5|nr:mandelate racemase/muconate lactonizing enzyme family protein [Niabella agricola]MCF3108213.1 mandelate racemase/muconate lactonizing enzyme family protein [Niabella agricola]
MYQIDNEVFRITRAQIRVLEPVPTVTPFQDATMGPFNHFGLSILTLEAEDGHIGEAPVFNTYMNILEKCLFPILFHSGNLPYKKLYTLLYWSIRNEGFRGQAAALLGQVDMALHDLAARRNRMPLYRYLNGNRNWVRMYGSGGGTNYSLKELETEISRFLEMGADCIKIKIGSNFGTGMTEDIERVRFVRQLIGSHVQLAVDANQIWTLDQALDFVNKIASLDIAWLEEPIHSAAYAEIEQLCKRSSIKIAYGESERTAKMFPALVNAGVAHLQPVPTQLGGIQEWQEVRDLAQKHQLDFSSGGYSLYTAALLTTAPEEWPVEYLYAIMYSLEQYFMVRPQWENGRFILPDIEGLPLRIDWDYWKQKQKIIVHRTWTKEDVKKYEPAVNM